MKTNHIFSFIIASVLLASCGKKNEQAQQAPGPMPFPVEKVVKQDATVYQEYTANLEGRQNVEIRPKVNGFIQKIYVDEGQQVRKGQILFKLETNTLNQDASAAKAAVNAAQVEVDRLKPLVDRNIISPVQLETAKAKLAQAKSTYGSVAANIGYGTITSPVDGFIGSLPYKEGALVSMSDDKPLTTVSDTRVMRAYFSLNEKQMIDFAKTFKGESLAAKLKNVPAVSLLLADNSEYDVKGKIETVNGQADPETGTTQFRAEFANPQAVLRSGGTGIVRIPVEVKSTILVPQNAVLDMQGKQQIYVVGSDNKVKSRIIKTNGVSGLNFIVSEGLQEGETVVIEGASKMKDDMQIVPQPKQPTAETAQNASDKDSAKATVK
ncbi:efflux RND transporter periplasmic adaptor subunit [Flavobacterium sp. MAH-1]|uniref:Efflux RND transporter periplasmic adaptor subunit n=1 Tax=Flavobacterium agri TaxID=2743471 RepID=A0A7Y8Y2L3_9FLAO|nr:efflux RND transporter periplasmic adaptor subunit [Flavobacterium agri]NUY81307.1 efflux RND transporter periplasmic adaptor subunit [Flavobacterium agri]NYA71331.1 efflux RND transporter periplasmic adaptor subunit [Flavobacterium agri]